MEFVALFVEKELINKYVFEKFYLIYIYLG